MTTFCFIPTPLFCFSFEYFKDFSVPIRIMKPLSNTSVFLRTICLFTFQNQTEPFWLYFLSTFSVLFSVPRKSTDPPLTQLPVIAFIFMPSYHNILAGCAWAFRTFTPLYIHQAVHTWEREFEFWRGSEKMRGNEYFFT